MTSRPNMFIVGAAKSGTSSLYHYLHRHPDIFMSTVKEPHYFCHDYFPNPFTGPGDEGFSRNMVRTMEDYLKLFESGKDFAIRGEASVYYLYFPEVAQRLYDFNPDAKVIIMLRNPVERAFSAYLHTVRDGRETVSFEQALDLEEKRRAAGYQPLWWLRDVGMYSKQVESYLRVFPENNIKIFLYEDLRDTPGVVKDTLAFLGTRTDVSIDTSIKHNASGVPRSKKMYDFFAKPNVLKEMLKPFLPQGLRRRLGEKAKTLALHKPEISATMRKTLQRDFEYDIRRLEMVLGRDLSAWLK